MQYRGQEFISGGLEILYITWHDLNVWCFSVILGFSGMELDEICGIKIWIQKEDSLNCNLIGTWMKSRMIGLELR